MFSKSHTADIDTLGFVWNLGEEAGRDSELCVPRVNTHNSEWLTGWRVSSLGVLVGSSRV